MNMAELSSETTESEKRALGKMSSGKMTSEQMSLEKMMPEKKIYTVSDMAAMLSIGKNAAYDLLHSGAFHAVKIGGQYRVSKKCFDKWLEGGENDG